MAEEPSDSDESGPSKGKAANIVWKDDKYYMEGSFVIFQVENCLFRIPTYLFARESQIFGGMFMLPQPGGDNVEGSTPSNPIILPDGHSEDFKNLMKVLYPKSVSPRLSLSKCEWVSVLKLATKWYFISLRTMAISELERLQELSSVEKVTLGRHLRISSWVIEGFQELVGREIPITDEEAIDLDFNYITTVYKLFRVRELRILRPISVGQEIEGSFQEELAAIQADEKGFMTTDEEIAFENAADGGWGSGFGKTTKSKNLKAKGGGANKPPASPFGSTSLF